MDALCCCGSIIVGYNALKNNILSMPSSILGIIALTILATLVAFMNDRKNDGAYFVSCVVGIRIMTRAIYFIFY
jgi:hypothetical protein